MADQEQEIVDPGGGGGGLLPHNIDFHTDADTTTTAPTTGDVLEWDGSDWVPKSKGAFTGTVAYNNPIEPPQLTIATHNYNPTGLADCNILRISSSTNVDLTGLEAPAPEVGQVILIKNIGSNNIILKNQDANSDPENRFDGGGNITIQGGEGIQVVYDILSDRWDVISKNV